MGLTLSVAEIAPARCFDRLRRRSDRRTQIQNPRTRRKVSDKSDVQDHVTGRFRRRRP